MTPQSEIFYKIKNKAKNLKYQKMKMQLSLQLGRIDQSK